MRQMSPCMIQISYSSQTNCMFHILQNMNATFLPTYHTSTLLGPYNKTPHFIISMGEGISHHVGYPLTLHTKDYKIVFADFEKLSSLYIQVFTVLCNFTKGTISQELFTIGYIYKC